MTVKGDLVASLVSQGYPHDQAQAVVKRIIDGLDDPNFAQRFDLWAQDEFEPTNRMNQYWQVVAFLKEMI